MTPEGAATPVPARTRVDPTMVKTLAWAHRWKRMLEDGRHASVSEMAAAGRIGCGYLGRILQLTLLRPASSRRSSVDGSLAAGGFGSAEALGRGTGRPVRVTAGALLGADTAR